MNNAFSVLKNNPGKPPFPFPGKVHCQDFSGDRFHNSDSRLFIRPTLFIEASIPPLTEIYSLPRINGSCFLLYVRDGQGQMEHQGDFFDLTAGSGIFAPADGTLHLKQIKGHLSCMLLFLTGDLLWELYHVKEEIICFRKFQFPDFEQRFLSFLTEYMEAESPFLFDFSRHVDHLLSRLIYQSVQDDRDESNHRKQILIHRSITYMCEHFCEPVRVGDIAASFGFSSSHFARIFQTEVKQSPKKYLIGLRLAHAEKLLTTSSLSIEDIGQECGFNTTTHFIQTFRDLHAMTPLQYRKQKNKNDHSKDF